MVLDMTQFGIAGFPDAATAGKSWVIGCVKLGPASEGFWFAGFRV